MKISLIWKYKAHLILQVVMQQNHHIRKALKHVISGNIKETINFFPNMMIDHPFFRIYRIFAQKRIQKRFKNSKIKLLDNKKKKV